MSTVYLVIGGFRFEGYSDPDSVWHNRDKALRRKEQLVGSKRTARYDFVDVFECPVSTTFAKMGSPVDVEAPA